MKKIFFFSLPFFVCTSITISQEKPWMIGPFTKADEVNPILEPKPTLFYDPVQHKQVGWEEKYVFNPAAVVRNGAVYLLYRAEDTVTKFAGVSRIGLAKSHNGLNFTTYKNPVLYPNRDAYFKYEKDGGCEDPRVVEDGNGNYYMYYTAYDGDKARLFVASSRNLANWKKYGSIFKSAKGDDFINYWSKSGAVVCTVQGNKLVATKINGKYWMYWGESNIYAATSTDLVNWQPVLETDPAKQLKDTMRGYDVTFKTVFGPRPGKFDSHLCEPGPPAILTSKGIVFLYNSRNHPDYGDKSLAGGTYAAGQVLLDKSDPMKVLDRCENYFFKPEKDYEVSGQVNHVTFIEGLVPFKGKWFLYYGTADTKIAVATALYKP